MISVTARKKIGEMLILFIIGGLIYMGIELLWRGHTHITMMIAGGLCFILIGVVNTYLPWGLNLVWQTAISVAIIKVVEFIVGLIVNVWLGLNVWCYADLTFNIMGQISLLFTILWIPLAIFAIFLDDWLRHWLFGEEKPRYRIL